MSLSSQQPAENQPFDFKSSQLYWNSTAALMESQFKNSELIGYTELMSSFEPEFLIEDSMNSLEVVHTVALLNIECLIFVSSQTLTV